MRTINGYVSVFLSQISPFTNRGMADQLEHVSICFNIISSCIVGVASSTHDMSDRCDELVRLMRSWLSAPFPLPGCGWGGTT